MASARRCSTGPHGQARAALRHGDNIVLATSQTVVELDPSGHIAFTATVATELLDGANSPDGTGLLIEANGRLHEVPANRSALLDLPSPPCTSTNAHRPRVALARRDRVLVSRPDQRLYSWNGAEWTRERPSTASFDAIALDDEAMIVIPTDDEMLLRRIGESAWRGIGNGFLTARATGVAPVGSGRFVAVGQSGRLVYWNGEKLCPQSVPTDRNFEDDDFAPGTRFAFTAGENYGDQTRPVRPVLVRLTTPR